MFRDYAPKGVRFAYLYKALAHPELNGYVNPATLDERLMHIEEAKRSLGTEIPWIADTMANELKRALGNRQNSEYVLDPRGRVLVARAWSDPNQLRDDLAKLVGAVENPTSVADLNMNVKPPPELAPTGIVPRIEKPGSYRTLTAEPQFAKTGEPFYAKLRAEADQDLLRSGEGNLYLALLPDPIHGVHWNNLAPVMEVELSAPAGMSVTPSRLKGPAIAEESDADPREFLVQVSRGNSEEPLAMKFRYFACTDAWCKPVTQEYRITWEVDRDAGRVRPGRVDFSRAATGVGRRRGAGGSGRESRNAASNSWRSVGRLLAMDADGDGRLAPEEVPAQARQNFERMDRNSDGYLDRREIEAIGQRVGRANRPQPGQGGWTRWDADGDGTISREEAPPQFERRFEALDANGDGFLDDAEMAAIRGARRNSLR